MVEKLLPTQKKGHIVEKKNLYKRLEKQVNKLDPIDNWISVSTNHGPELKPTHLQVGLEFHKTFGWLWFCYQNQPNHGGVLAYST